MNATTSCAFSTPLDYQGNAPTTITDVWSYSNLTCNTEYATSSVPVETINGFTHGELVNSYLLLGILILAAYLFVYFGINGIKLKT